MPLHDQHLHSRHSFDCQTPPEDNVEAALEKGLAGLTFTEHFDTHPEEWKTCIYDHQAYTDSIRDLRGRHPDIFIGQGIEVGYYRPEADRVLDLLTRHPFDLVILSLHLMDNRLLHVRSEWDEAGGLEEGTRLYFDQLIEAVEHARDVHRRHGQVFHVLGHLDLVKRYTNRLFGRHVVERYMDEIDRVLRTCLEADLVPEINTSSLRQGLEETMPGLAVIRRYAELGGVSVSLGSDAHRADDLGAGFDHALAMLEQAGLSKVALFKRGRREDVPWK